MNLRRGVVQDRIWFMDNDVEILAQRLYLYRIRK
jgi:hypothetical protein